MVQVREVSTTAKGSTSDALPMTHHHRAHDATDSEYTDMDGDGSEEFILGNKNSSKWYWRWLPAFLTVPLQDPWGWSHRTWSRLRTATRWMGQVAWIFTTSMLLVGLPVLFAYDREKALQEQQLLSIPPSS